MAHVICREGETRVSGQNIVALFLASVRENLRSRRTRGPVLLPEEPALLGWAQSQVAEQ